MEINLFSKCIKDLIVENDKVEVPYLGVFSAEMVPASYSDRQTTINPPYRKINFHKEEVSSADGQKLLAKVAREAGVSQDQALVELGWCLSRLCSELEGRKNCKLPGLGTMRANARNEFFFVPDDELDIWPDGLGFEPISIKISEKKEEMPGQAGHDERRQAGAVEDNLRQASEPGDELRQAGGTEEDFAVSAGEPLRADETQNRPGDELRQVGGPEEDFAVSAGEPLRADETQNRPGARREEPRKKLPAWAIVLIVAAALVALFIAASYLFTEQMSPILDHLLYTKEELELLGR